MMGSGASAPSSPGPAAINTTFMAKRSTGVGKPRKTSSRKTAKRLEIKRVRLEELAAKRKKK